MAAVPPIEVKVTADTANAEAGLDRVAGKTDTLKKKSILGAGGARMLTQQLSQVAQQATATGQPIQALAVQAADIGLAFGAVGTVIGAVAGIALPTLMAAFSGAEDDTKRFDDALRAVDDTMTQLREPMSILTMSVDELREKYGQAADQVLRYAQFQAESRAAFAAAALKEQINLLDGTIYKYMTTVDAGQRYRNVLKRIEKDLKISGAAAIEFEDALTDLNAATTFDDQQAALNRVLDLIKKNGTSAADIPPELRRALDEMVSLTTATEEARRIMALLGAESRNVSVGTGWEFDPATDMPPPRRPKPSTGGGRTDPTKSRLEALKKALATEAETLSMAYQQQIETLQSAMEKKLITQEEFQALSLASADKYQTALADLERQRQAARMSDIAGAFGDLSSLMSTQNKKLFKIGKAAALAEAVVNGYSAAVSAWDKGMKVGGPTVAAAFTAASLAKTGALIAGISSQEVGGGAGGASTGGGSAPTGAASQGPLEVRLQGVTATSLFTGASIGSLFDMLNAEAGDRGVRVVYA